MNANRCTVVLRPRSPFESLDLGLRLGWVHRSALARVLAPVLVPSLLVACVLAWWLDGSWWALGWPVLVAPLLQAPVTVCVGRLLFGEALGAWETWREVASRAGALLLVWLVLGVMIVLSLLTCAVALLPVLAGLLFLPETALLERVGLRRGLSRSVRLALGYAPGAMAGALGVFVLAAWAASAFEATGQALVGFLLLLGEPFGQLLEGDLTPYVAFGLTLLPPLHALWRLMLYVDVRTRVEGWDLQVGLRAAGLER